MNKYDVIAIAESSRYSESSHKIQAEYFISSGIINFTSEGLGPIECYILNKYKNPDHINMFTLTGNGTRTLLNMTNDVTFIPIDYFKLFIKNNEMLKLIPNVIASNLVMDVDGLIIDYKLDSDYAFSNIEDKNLHTYILNVMNNKSDRLEFMFKNLVNFIKTNKLFILGYKFELGKFGIGLEIKKLIGDKFISIGIGVISNFQINLLRMMYNVLPNIDDHVNNIFAPDAEFMVDDIYKYIHLTKFEKGLKFEGSSLFIWTKKLSPTATFHQFSNGLSPPLLGTIKKKDEKIVSLNFKKYQGYSTPVHIYDALIILRESIYNPDNTI